MPAGSLALVDAATGASWGTLFTPGGLSYQAPSSEVDVYRLNGVLRQIHLPQASVDIVAESATKFSVKFYNPSQAIAGTNPRAFTGSPYVTYTIEQDQVGATSLLLTKELRNLPDLTTQNVPVARTEYTKLSRSGTYPTFTWKHRPWDTSLTLPFAEVQTNWSTTSNGRVAVKKIGTPGVSDVTFVTHEEQITYGAYNWGEEVKEEIIGNSTDAKERKVFSYYEIESQSGSYGLIKSIVTQSTAQSATIVDWVAYEYENVNATKTNVGNVSRRHRPFKDAPSTVPADLAANTAGEITTYTYSADAFGMMKRPASILTRVNGVLISESTYSYSGFAANSLNIVKAENYVSVDNDPTARLKTTTCYYREDTVDPFFRNQLHSITQPDGRKQSHVRQRGTWSNNSFAANASGLASRICVIEGYSVAVSGFTSLQTFEGYTIDPLYLAANKSVMRVEIRDANASLVKEEVRVWTGSEWVSVSGTNYGYNLAMQMSHKMTSNGGSTTFTYNGESVESETDDAGIRKDYITDSSGRSYIVIQQGVDGVIGDLVVEYEYDTAGRRKKTKTYALDDANGEKIITNVEYSTAGDMVSETGDCQCPTQYAYDSSTRSTTTTYTDGGTKIVRRHLDGKTEYMTGSSTVAKYYDYEIGADGTQLVRVREGGPASPRFVETVRDLAGRVIAIRTPTFAGASPSTATTEMRYQKASGRPWKVESTMLAPRVMVYDELGQMSRVGIDLDNNGLVLQSGDRIREEESFYELYEGAWWLTTRHRVYAKPNDQEATVFGLTRERLTGFGTDQRSETRTWDIGGNMSSVEETVDSTTHERKRLTTRSDAINVKVETFVAGLPTAITDHNGGTSSYVYDGLHRVMIQINGRENVQRLTYYAGTRRPETIMLVKEFGPGGSPSGPVTSYSYDQVGRTKRITNTDTKFTNYRYDQHGRLIKKWGAEERPSEWIYDPIYGDLRELRCYATEAGWLTSSEWPAAPGSASVTSWEYDLATGLLRDSTDDAGRVTSFTYNARSQIVTRTVPRDAGLVAVTTFNYEDNSSYQTGELRNITYSGAGSEFSSPVTYMRKIGDTGPYDRLGRVLKIEDATGTRMFEYSDTYLLKDSEELPAFFGVSTQSTARRLTFSYSDSFGVRGRPLGYVLGYELQRDLGVQYNYDPDTGRLSSIDSDANVGSTIVGSSSHAYSYVYGSNEIESVSNGQFARTTVLEPWRLATESIETVWGGSTVARFAYANGETNRRDSVKVTGILAQASGQNYGYQTDYSYSGMYEIEQSNKRILDSTGQVTALSDHNYFGGFEYDYQGNRTSESRKDQFGVVEESIYAVTNQLNQYESITGFRADLLTYYRDGSLKSDSRWTYEYDGEGRLAKMIRADGLMRLDFVYDYAGRRVRKTVRSGPYLTSAQTLDLKYIYHGWNLIAEIDGSSEDAATVRSYVWGIDLSGAIGGDGIGGLLQMHDSSGRYFPIYDASGSVQGLLNDSGDIVAKYSYSVYGGIVDVQGDAIAGSNPIRYSSKYYDHECDLVYFGYRYYSSRLGRFISRDPVGIKGDLNLYSYAAGDPVNQWDYLGLDDMPFVVFSPFPVTDRPDRGLEIFLDFGRWLQIMIEVNERKAARDDSVVRLPPKEVTAIRERQRRVTINTSIMLNVQRMKFCGILKKMMDTYSKMGREQIADIGTTGRDLNRVGDVYSIVGVSAVTIGTAYNMVQGAYSAASSAAKKISDFHDIVDGIPFLTHETRESWKSGYYASVELATYAESVLGSAVGELVKWAAVTELAYGAINDVLHDTINADMKSLVLDHADMMRKLSNAKGEFEANKCHEFY
jgi:RHS repeat-associated protein